LSQFVSAPTSVHYSHLHRVLRYFEARSPVISFSLVLAPYSSRPTLMPHGLVILRIAARFPPTVCFLVVLSLHGRQRNRPPSPARVQRLS
jgi:hypothetical protein